MTQHGHAEVVVRGQRHVAQRVPGGRGGEGVGLDCVEDSCHAEVGAEQPIRDKYNLVSTNQKQV